MIAISYNQIIRNQLLGPSEDGLYTFCLYHSFACASVRL